MTAKEKALIYLCREYLNNIDMIECIRRDICTLIYAESDGVFLKVNGETTCMLSCDSTELALRVTENAAADCEMLVAHQEESVEPLLKKYGFEAASECWQAAYISSNPLPETGTDIRRLGMEYAEFVAKTYRDGQGWQPYIEQLIGEGVMYGAFIDGELAGFIGRHGEGALGLLEVLPQYRRRGLAEALEINAINREMSQGHVPYGHIFLGNEASRSLQIKTGQSFSDKNVWWLYK